MMRIVALILTLSACAAHTHDLKDCRGQTFGPGKFGNLEVMSWHIHYNTNTTGQRLFYEAFIKEFYNSKKFPFPPGTATCPFGPNWGAADYPYVCSLDPPYENWGADTIAFLGDDGPDPWFGPQRAFFFPIKYIDEAWEWAQKNRFHTDILHHPNTGCMHDDHSVRALWVAEDPKKTPMINISNFPCNMPGTGCNDTLWPTELPACHCVDKLPLPDDSPENSCNFCMPNGGEVKDLEFACTEPALQVNYVYIRGYSGVESCGNLFSEADIGGGINVPPVVKYPSAQKGSLYTLIMIDPDADLPHNGSWPNVTTPGSHAPVRHWVIGNLDAEALRTGDFATGTTVSPFLGPSPPYGSHRYGQFLFEQFQKFDFEDLTDSLTVQWDYKGFLGKYALGDTPVASNWQIVEHADIPEPNAPGEVKSELEVAQLV